MKFFESLKYLKKINSEGRIAETQKHVKTGIL